MKKYIVTGLLAAVCALGVAACAQGGTEPIAKPSEDIGIHIPVTEAPQMPQATPAQATEAAQTPAPTPVPTTEATPEAAAEATETGEPEPTMPPPASPEGAARPFPEQPHNPYGGAFGSPYAGDVLSNHALSWYYGKNADYQPPTGNPAFDVRPFGGYYLGDINRRDIFLTFDEGYENGYTAKILDVLLEKDVPAAFFVTKSYIERNPELIQRMIEEGHVVGNHSVSHKSSPSLTDEELRWEIEETARFYKAQTGQDMPGLFRPPMGEYSARTLQITQDLGCKTIFWSFAYQDWLVDQQPTAAYAFEEIVSHMHNGAVPLLHAVSQANTEALPDVIDALRAEGFTFRALTELPE